MSSGQVGCARSVALVGMEAVAVTVEAHVGSGLPGLSVIGLGGGSGRQAADRVRTALSVVGVMPNARKILLSLAPADVPKAGAGFDLAMAMAVLAAIGAVPQGALTDAAFMGELALDGALRPSAGVLPAAAALGRHGVTRLLVPDDNAAEASLGAGPQVVPVATLAETVAVLRGEQAARPAPVIVPGDAGSQPPDLSEVRGQHEARRALELAAAGGHHILLLGTPGCGKSMLARRLPSILPPLPHEHALEVASIRSVAGAPGSAKLDFVPPFRAPHRGASTAALLGGGTGIARPGEVVMAHRGVLFLDELFEWPRSVLESLREPLEEGAVRICRARATVSFPARFQLVCAANPCPCGGGSRCLCSDDEIWRYRSRLSGALADRLDLAPVLTPLTADDLLSVEPGEASVRVAQRVEQAHGLAAERVGRRVVNAHAPVALLRRTARPQALSVLAAAVEAGEVSARGYDRTLRVARTCADLEGSELIERGHVLEAQAHRFALRRAQQPAGVG